MDIYKGRETRHRAKSLAHATEYEFRLKVGRSMSNSQAFCYAVTLYKAALGLGLLCRSRVMSDLCGIPVMIDSVNQGKPCSGAPGCCPQRTLAEVAAMAPARRRTRWRHADLKANLRDTVHNIAAAKGSQTTFAKHRLNQRSSHALKGS